MITQLIKEKKEEEKKLSKKEKQLINQELNYKKEYNTKYTETEWKTEPYKKYTNKELKEAYITKTLHSKKIKIETLKQEIKEIRRNIENITFQIKYIINNSRSKDELWYLY